LTPVEREVEVERRLSATGRAGGLPHAATELLRREEGVWVLLLPASRAAGAGAEHLALTLAAHYRRTVGEDALRLSPLRALEVALPKGR